MKGNGDLFDDSYLRDTRFKPMPLPEATKTVDRYAIVVPPGTRGPIALTAAVYYQSVEAVVALKFLGNMADTNENFVLEPCFLGGLCDGRTASAEPAVVEGAPAVPMIVRNFVIPIAGTGKKLAAPVFATYPQDGASHVYPDAVVKVFFSKPVRGVTPQSFILTDSKGGDVPAQVDQIGDGVWGLFPNLVLLKPGERYTARLRRGVCDFTGNCTSSDLAWSFKVSPEDQQATGDTSIPVGFAVELNKGRLDPAQ